VHTRHGDGGVLDARGIRRIPSPGHGEPGAESRGLLPVGRIGGPPASDVTRGDVRAGVAFLSSLISPASGRLGSLEAHSSLRERFEHRERDFLALVDSAIYRNPTSPYRQLLALAGCELGDVENLIRQEGLEGALGALYRRGVYLTVDELKGRRPAVRGSATVHVEPRLLRVPGAAAHVVTHSSGHRGSRTMLAVDVTSVRVQASNLAVLLEARDGLGWVHATWAIPGSAVTVRLHQFQMLGLRVARWFSQVDARAPGLHARYRWSVRLQRLGSWLSGVPLPAPEYVPVGDPLPIARWMATTIREGRTPHLWTFPSSAVRVCQTAAQAGLQLAGAQFTTSGEPMTSARRRTIERLGAIVQPLYGSSETGLLGYGCLVRDGGEDFHVLSDVHALIQAGPSQGPFRPRALLVTSLRSTARAVLLNVSLGDEAELDERPCGCPLERLGWRQHVRTVRSFEKLNAGGIALLDTDVITVLEETLPTRFGGGPTDYQLVEDESTDGRPRLRLLVHPALGPLDEAAVADVFLRSIGEGSGVERLVELQWRQAGLPMVERRAPRATASGKIRHLDQSGDHDAD
jgi:hypothetical protein